jgi:hypothetical protein
VEDAWLRACARCGEPFLVDRACGFNRRYCGDACAAVGRAESVGRAQETYRHKPAVQKRHREQEGARRARLKERVRDHIQQPAGGRASVERMVARTAPVAPAAAPPAVALAPLAVALAPPTSELPPPTVALPPPAAGLSSLAPATRWLAGTASPVAATTPSLVAPSLTASPRLAQWRLIVGHALAAHADALRRAGTVVRCACCGRAGRVVTVVVRTELEWRRQGNEDGA